MGSIITYAHLEVQRLVDVGVLTKGMTYRINPSPDILLSFCNRLEGRTMYAEIECDGVRLPTEAFGMLVTEHVDGQEPEIVSTYRHSSLEHLVRGGRAFLCFHSADRKSIKKVAKAVLTVRVDEDLRRTFETAAVATGESKAVVMRQLMRFFIGTGPDPRMEK